MSKSGNGKIGFWAVVAIGVGGMVGGGIFAVLGLAVQLARGGTPMAFALAGVVALLTTYSYAKLSVAHPSRGGTVTFLDQAFGSGMLTGSLNVLLWLSYVVMLSLYAFAFGSYGTQFLPEAWQAIGKHVLISFSVFTIAGLNLLDAKLIGEAEDWIVGSKVLILLFFVVTGLPGIHPSQIAPSSWSPALQLDLRGVAACGDCSGTRHRPGRAACPAAVHFPACRRVPGAHQVVIHSTEILFRRRSG